MLRVDDPFPLDEFERVCSLIARRGRGVSPRQIAAAHALACARAASPRDEGTIERLERELGLSSTFEQGELLTSEAA